MPLRSEATKDISELMEEQSSSFHTLMKLMIPSKILAVPRKVLAYIVETDASEYKVGTAQFQTEEEKYRRPFVFWIRTLKNTNVTIQYLRNYY